MKTILTAEFRHETNRYAYGITDLQAYKQRNAVFGEAAVRQQFAGAENEMTGFDDYFADIPDYQVVPVLAMNASPGGVVAQSVWELVKDSLLEAIDQTPEIDGLLLCLHGAMVTEEMEDGEGELLQILRQRLGPDIPIIATLDLHANVTKKMMEYADAYFSYEYYPHTDLYETGKRAAQCMHWTLEGEIRPVMAYCKLDMMLPYMPTEDPSFAPFLAQAQGLRGAGRLIDVTICHGFFASDIYEQGVAVLAVADGDAELAQRTADDLGGQIFAARKQLRRNFYSPQEAVTKALRADRFPVVLADVSDNPGSGGSADATGLLRELIEKDAQNVAVAVIFDPETVQLAKVAGVENEITVQLGGKTAPEVTGGPVCCKAVVKALTDGKFRNQGKMWHGVLMNFGDCALLKIGGVQVIVCSVRAQPLDLEIYRHCGIAPEQMKILVVKSAAHFRASFGTIASQILDVQAPALAPQNPEMLPLSHSRRPIYPLDDI